MSAKTVTDTVNVEKIFGLKSKYCVSAGDRCEKNRQIIPLCILLML